MKKFREYLCEKETKASCKEKFEKWIFGEFRGKEDDTPKEDYMWERLMTFISYNSHSSKLKKDFEILQDCMPYYKEALKPNAKIVYRGTSMTANKIKSIKWTGEWKNFWVGDYVYKPHGIVQSWSTEWKIAEGWNDFSNHNYLVTLEAKVDDSFIFNADFLNKIDKATGISPESEIVRVGKQPIKTRIYISKRQYDEIIRLEKVKRTKSKSGNVLKDMMAQYEI